MQRQGRWAAAQAAAEGPAQEQPQMQVVPGEAAAAVMGYVRAVVRHRVAGLEKEESGDGRGANDPTVWE